MIDPLLEPVLPEYDDCMFENWKQYAEAVTPNRLRHGVPRIYNERHLTYFEHLRINGGDPGTRLPISRMFESFDCAACFTQYKADSAVRLTKQPPARRRHHETGEVIETEEEYDARHDLALGYGGQVFHVMNIDLDVADSDLKPLDDEWFYLVVTLSEIQDHVPNVVMQSKSGGAHLLYLIEPMTDQALFEAHHKRLTRSLKPIENSLKDATGRQILKIDPIPSDWTRLTNCSRIVYYSERAGWVHKQDVPVWVVHDGVLNTTRWKVKVCEPTAYVRRAKAGSCAAENRAKRYVARCTPAISGENGNNKTYSLICKLLGPTEAGGFGLNREQVLGALDPWNLICDPPWTEHELIRKIEHAAGRLYGGTNAN